METKQALLEQYIKWNESALDIISDFVNKYSENGLEKIPVSDMNDIIHELRMNLIDLKFKN
jgi:hypothetical protein